MSVLYRAHFDRVWIILGQSQQLSSMREGSSYSSGSQNHVHPDAFPLTLDRSLAEFSFSYTH